MQRENWGHCINAMALKLSSVLHVAIEIFWMCKIKCSDGQTESRSRIISLKYLIKLNNSAHSLTKLQLIDLHMICMNYGNQLLFQHFNPYLNFRGTIFSIRVNMNQLHMLYLQSRDVPKCYSRKAQIVTIWPSPSRSWSVFSYAFCLVVFFCVPCFLFLRSMFYLDPILPGSRVLPQAHLWLISSLATAFKPRQSPLTTCLAHVFRLLCLDGF